MKHSGVLATISVHHAINDACLAAIPVVMPLIRDEYDLNYTQIGILTGIGLSITLGGQLFMGRKGDYHAPGRLIGAGVLLLAISILAMTFSTVFWQLMLAYCLLRFGASVYHPVGIGWVSRLYKGTTMEKAMSIQSASADLALFISVMVTGYMAFAWGWRAPLTFWGAIAIPLILIGLIVFERSYGELNRPSMKGAVKGEDGRPAGAGFRAMIGPMIVSGATWGTFASFGPLHFTDTFDLNEGTIGIILAVWYGTGTFATFMYSRVRKHIERGRLFTLCYSGMILSGVLLFALPKGLDVALYPIAALLGVSLFITYPIMFSEISEGAGEGEHTKHFAYAFTAQLAGGVAFITVGGAVADRLGINTPFALTASAAMVILFMFMTRQRTDTAGNGDGISKE